MTRYSRQDNYNSLIFLSLLLAGFFKGLSSFFLRIEIDFVKISGFLAFLVIIYQIITEVARWSPYLIKLFASILIFYGWMIFTLPYSPSETYKYDKIVSFFPSLLYFLYPLYIKRINFDLFIQGYAIIVIPLSVLLIYFKSITWSGNIESPELWVGNSYDYLGLGLHLGILFLLLHWFKKSKVLQLATFLLLFASSARGPFLFVLVLFIAINYKTTFRSNFIRNFFNFRLLVLVLFPLVFFSTAILSFFNNGYLRFISLFSSTDSSSATRFQQLEFAFSRSFDEAVTLIFGHGIGSFGILYQNVDTRAYPHNILLEILFELGLIGLFLSLIIFFYTLIRFDFRKNVFSVLLVFVFLNALKSSNLTDSWILFSFIGASSAHYLKANYRRGNYKKRLV